MHVTPQLADGTAAPDSPLSTSLEAPDIVVFLDDGVDFTPADVSFAGLAPGFVGLYQVNFALPESGLENGDVDVIFATNEAINDMATISLSGFSDRAKPMVRSSSAFRLASRRVAAGSHYREHARSLRRALP